MTCFRRALRPLRSSASSPPASNAQVLTDKFGSFCSQITKETTFVARSLYPISRFCLDRRFSTRKGSYTVKISEEGRTESSTYFVPAEWTVLLHFS